MSTAFTITTTTNTVQVDDQRQAGVSYTVFNAAGQEMEGRASVVSAPANAPHQAWSKLAEGEAERHFGVAAVEQYAVKITVPPDTPAGNYIFRLNMVGVHNPDETFSEGPTVTIVVPAPKAPPKKLPVWMFPVAGVVVLLLIVVLFLVLRKGSVSVPNVAGLSEANAIAALEAAGLKEGSVRGENSPTVGLGLVIRSEPAAGASVADGSEVALILSTGSGVSPTPITSRVILILGDESQLGSTPDFLEAEGFDVVINRRVVSADFALLMVSVADGPMPRTKEAMTALSNRPSGNNIAIILTGARRISDGELENLVLQEVRELFAAVVNIRAEGFPVLSESSATFKRDLLQLLP